MGDWIKEILKIIAGLKTTFKAFMSFRISSKGFDEKGSVTLQYPFEKPIIPINGRYQLDVTIEDCIVCDLCAKVCPVNCITIEPIRAIETFGTTSDGSPKKIYPAQFDIDMAKCMYCGLCTTVCPTECIIMTDVYDKSVSSIKDLNYEFSTMSIDQVNSKKGEWEAFQLEKQKAKEQATPQKNDN